MASMCCFDLDTLPLMAGYRDDHHRGPAHHAIVCIPTVLLEDNKLSRRSKRKMPKWHLAITNYSGVAPCKCAHKGSA